jgi:manganese transport protein
VVLSLGIPFVLIPLVRLTSLRSLLGDYVNRRSTTVTAILIAVLIIALNLALIVITIAG